MKRFFALVALVLGLASCQTEPEGLDVQMGGAVDATITVNIPDSETRAGGTNSAGSIFDNVDLSGDATIRYILKIYQKVGDEYVESKDRQFAFSDGKSVNFDVRLVPGRHYSFVVWADYVEREADVDYHYNTADLRNITLKADTWVAMDETRDAFTGIFNTAEDGNKTPYNGAKDINITLTRPFAKLRIITTDIKELKYLDITPAYATVEYTTEYRPAFDALAGTAKAVGADKKAHSTVFPIAPYTNEANDEHNRTIFTDYFFAENGDAVSFILNVYEDEAKTKPIKSNNFSTDIAVNRNYLTTISGSILTDGNKVNVTIEDAFENVDDNGNTTNPDYDYETISSDNEFLAAVNTPGKYVVISDLHIANEGDTVTTLATRAGGATTTIDLNGKTITVDNKGTGALASVTAGNTLVITNSVAGGKIELTEGSTGAFIENNGTVVIENGSIKSNSTNDSPVIENNGTTNITGGVIGDNAVENTQNGDVNITGGTLEGDDFDDFIDDDYTKNENNEIVKKPTIAKIGDVEYRTLQRAFDAVDNGTITLVDNVTLVETATLAEGKVATLDLDGNTITAASYAIMNYGTLTINGNGTINGIVYCEATGNTTVENGTFNAPEGGKYVFLNSQGGTLTINGGTINGGSDYPIYSYDENSRLVINNVTVNASFGCVNAYGTNGSVVINGGTYKMTGVQGKTSHIAYFSNVDATINGGTFQKTGDINMSAAGGGGICAIYGANLTINGGNFEGDYADVYNWSGTNANGRAVAISIKGGSYKFEPNPAFVAEGSEVIRPTEANGVWTVRIIPVAKIGETEYETLEAAAAAAQAGDTITVLRDITLAEELGLPASIIFNGNGKQINGPIYAGGDLTFVGHTKVTAFSASYYDRVITIGEGACLEVTGTGRVTLGYRNTFNITGSVENAKTADKANIQPSLIIPAGISITGGNDAAMNVTNAYVKIGSTTSKNSAANGEFTLNITNSIAEFTNQLTFSEPTNGNTPTFNVNITNSVLTTGTKLILAAPDCEMNVNNSTINVSTYFGNSGAVSLTNGSVLNGGTIQNSEGRNHCGSTVVNNSTFTITCGGSTGHAYDGLGTGSITAENGATVKVEYYKDMTINVDATSTFTGVDVDANKKIYYTGDMKVTPTNVEAFGGAAIASSVFENGKGVIKFDKDITTIGTEAFRRNINTDGCNWWTSITLPKTVTSIGNYAFYQNFSLETINIPDSVVSIGEYAFSSCNAATSVTIGSGVTNIASGAFYASYEIKEIVCKPTTPPTLADKWVFYNVTPERVVVPAASVDAYKAAWSVFADKIVAGEF